jgi:membrane-associated protease RseP (regulator of RpoE activity)
MHASELDPPDRQAVSVAPADRAVTSVATPRRTAAMPIITIAVTAIALLSGSALFLSGYSMGRQSAVEPGTPGDEGMAFQPFWDTYHTIEDRYAGGPVDREAVVQGAIRGMIDSLEDPYSSYLTSDQYRSSLQGISGQFEGIGAEIATQASDGTQGCATLGPTCRLVIIAPIGGSPAEKAGLRPGDLVLATDGVPLDGLTVDAARERMRGPKDTTVHLSVLRGGDTRFTSRSCATSSRSARSRRASSSTGASATCVSRASPTRLRPTSRPRSRPISRRTAGCSSSTCAAIRVAT